MKPNAIDISEFQDPSTFDYQAVKDAGITTLIIRAGYHLRQDKFVKQHIANAEKYGFKWHLYHYWLNDGKEIAWAIQNAKDLGLTRKQILFLDMEDKSLSSDWNGQFSQFRKEAMKSFRVGLYCSDSPYKAKFSDSQLTSLNVVRWVASYSYEPKNYDVWQMSGAGGGGFGSYKHDVDRDYDKNNSLSYNEHDYPTPPHYDAPEQYRNIVLQPGFDSEAGIYGLGCSADNGQTFKVYWTIFGRKMYQEDADRLWPFLKDKIGDIKNGSLNVTWNDIQNKPDVATQEDLKNIELKPGPQGPQGPQGVPGEPGKDAPLPDMTQYVLVSSLDKLKATLNSNIDASKVSYEQIYPTLINGTTGSVNAFLITLSEKVKMLAFWANVTLPTIPGWSQVDIMSFPEMHEQNHITLNQAVVPDSSHSLWSDYTSTRFSLRNQTSETVSNYSFNFFSSGIFLY